MKQVYAPSNSAEAHMIAHMLKHAGISAHIQGEALTGAMGHLPVNDLVKVAVSDDDYERARMLVLEWEKSSPPPEPASPPTRVSNVGLIAFLLVGVMIGWLGHMIVSRNM